MQKYSCFGLCFMYGLEEVVYFEGDFGKVAYSNGYADIVAIEQLVFELDANIAHDESDAGCIELRISF